MSLDKHTLKTETWTYDPWVKEKARAAIQEQTQKKLGDDLYVTKKVSDWDLRLDVNQYGKMTMIGEKSLGRLGTIKVIVESKEDTAPLVKLMPIPYDIITHEGKYVEINNRQGITNEEFKKEDKDEYTRQFLGSSIVTPSEFFNQAVPSFFALLEQKTLDDFVPKIETELSKLQRPKYQAEK